MGVVHKNANRIAIANNVKPGETARHLHYLQRYIVLVCRDDRVNNMSGRRLRPAF